MTESLEELITVEDAARLLGVPRSWVYANTESGRLPSFRIGKYRRLKASELLSWIERHHEGNSNGGRK